MMQQFSWHQFLFATGVLTVLWYVGVILLYFKVELNSLLASGSSSGRVSQPLPHRWEKDVETVEEESLVEDDGLMGKSKLPDGMSVIGTEQISFASDDGAKVQKIGLVSDVVQELKEIFSVLAKQDGNKKDFFGMMEMVRLNFPSIGSHPNIGQINAFISEHAPFHLTPEELENLWD
ncbi:hypothetical protein WG904_17655 [Pedobacter sp. Du54]|uniref:hypothetical protein n=1 Tax=Pedobacter anseongensis TaxID=3133439 RepID=UPI00309E1F93